MEWARFNLRVWTEESAKFRLLSPDDRRLAAALYLHASANGFIVDTPLAIAAAAWEDDTNRSAEIREKLRSFGFALDNGRWFEKNALAVYDQARHRSLVNAQNRKGKAGSARPSDPATDVEGSSKDPSRIPSPSPSVEDAVIEEQDQVTQVVVEEKVSTYKGGEQMALAVIEPVVEAVVVEKPRVAPPMREQAVRHIARRFMLARSLRLWGKQDREPSEGSLRSIARRIDERLRDGFEADFLVALPVLVEDASLRDGARLIDVMLKRDPEVLLRTDNAQGGKCHARRIEGNLDDLVLVQRQVDILNAVDAWEWARTRIKVREGVC
jgi:hypothetical protein